jgi:DNA-binding ferritin-like protein (Dps family)
MGQSDVHGATTREVLAEGLAGVSGEPLFVNPTRAMVRELVEMYRDDEELPGLQLLADAEPLKELAGDFMVSSALADLIDEGRFRIRTLAAVPRHSILVTEESLLSLVEGDEQVAGLGTDAEEFVAETLAEYERRWDEAEAFSLRTPPLSDIRATLGEDIGEAAVEDFDRILDTLDEAKGDGEGLDEVTIALLVAANNGELLYDISRWGEDIRLASKATFSRNKNLLEEAGLLDTEKVPIDIGRPRLRLLFADSSLQDVPIEEVVERAERELA